jgi:hypothetical protein
VDRSGEKPDEVDLIVGTVVYQDLQKRLAPAQSDIETVRMALLWNMAVAEWMAVTVLLITCLVRSWGERRVVRRRRFRTGCVVGRV